MICSKLCVFTNFALGCFLFFSFLLASCSNNSKNNCEFSDKTEGPQKRLSQLIVNSRNDWGIVKFSIEYDEQGRIVKVDSDRSDKFMTLVCDYNDNFFRIGEYTGILNDDGYVYFSNHPLIEEEEFVGNFVYNNKGQLAHIHNSIIGKVSFKWKNDNLIQRKVSGYKTYYYYTSIEDKAKLGFIHGFLGSLSYENTIVPNFPYYMLLGEHSKCLPSAIGAKRVNHKMSYILDDEGYVEEMIVIYPYNNGYSQYMFEYENVDI